MNPAFPKRTRKPSLGLRNLLGSFIARLAALELRRPLALAAACSLPLAAFSQAGGEVPVYQVIQSGATAVQSASLAQSLNIPAGQLAQSNGMVLFIDPTNYLNVPSTAVTNPVTTSNLVANTKNLFPAIPIQVQAVNFNALSNLTLLDDASALNALSNALSTAGLYLAGVTPVPSHRTFTYYYTNDAGAYVSNSVPLDVNVRYRLTTDNGYPLVGPGAQIQASFGAGGGVTRLVYSARQLQQGNMVRLVPPTVASNQFAAMFPPNTVLSNLQMVYWAPPFLPWYAPGGNSSPATILPWYSCGGTVMEGDPASGNAKVVHLKPRMIPATDDPAFIPFAGLSVSTPTPGQVLAGVAVSGGAPPYAYIWSGSDPAISTNTGPHVSYTPRARVPLPPLSILPSPGPVPQLDISWPASPFTFVLESATSFEPVVGAPQWSPVNQPVNSDGETQSVTVPIQSDRNEFFRLRLANGMVSQDETVAVTVVDANGVSSTVSQTVPVLANPDRSARGGPPVIGWGTESPFEPGGFAVDRIGWQAGMGVAGGGGGSELFCWTGSTSWPGDFIEPPVPGTLPAKPWINGCADYSNWGVNTASIVLNNCDGASDCFTSSQPGATVAEYNTALLSEPIDSWTVAINLYQGGGTSSNQVYHVNYNYSWGPLGPNDNLNWLCLDCCNALDFYGAGGLLPGQRWGKAFGGLHILTGFDSEEAVADGSFERDFGWFMLAGGMPAFPLPPLTIVQSWFAAGELAGIDAHGVPAVMGPLGSDGTFNEADFYWGKGPVGPTIPPSKIAGWWGLEDH